MAHFAKIDDDDNVINVTVAESEEICQSLDPGRWIKTSYNTYAGKHFDPVTRLEDDGTPLRKNYAGIGMIYDEVRDAFMSPKPFPSWILDEDTCHWEPPVPLPADCFGVNATSSKEFVVGVDKEYEWNEDTTSWDLVVHDGVTGL